jgi:CubicO group peptidase (beta-lactamase class C family)
VFPDIGHLVADWPVPTVAAGVSSVDATLAVAGDPDWVVRVASISKVMVGYAAMLAVEEGTITLDEPAGRPGATVRHLLAHAAGYEFDGSGVVAEVGRRRVYSNVGIEIVAHAIGARAGIPFDRYLSEGIFHPLGMRGTTLLGSPAHGVHSSIRDLLVFAREMLRPRLISPGSRDEMVTIQFPELAGVMPGVGRFDPNPWGIGAEIKGGKSGHWTGSLTSSRTFGHFGGAGTFLWVDPELELAAAAIGDRDFGPWSLEVWPVFSGKVVKLFT